MGNLRGGGRKLRLGKESLRRLDGAQLAEVRGGGSEVGVQLPLEPGDATGLQGGVDKRSLDTCLGAP